MKHEVIYVQWTNNFGGLEKISVLFEEKFKVYFPRLVIFQYNESGIRYRNFKIIPDKPKLLFIFNYLIFIWRNNSSVIHIQYAGSAILFLTYLAGARNIIYHFHGTKFPNRFFNKLTWRMIGNKITVIANSAHTQNIIREKLDFDGEINLIPNYIDLREFNYVTREYTDGKFIITFAGRFDRGKNIDILIDTAKYLSDIDSDIEFHLVGDGPEKHAAENKIASENLMSKVKLIPFTQDMQKVYHSSHLFLFLSSYESFGNVVAEAMLTGLPVLCYDIPAVKELVQDDFFLISKLDPKIIAERIIAIKGQYSHAVKKVTNIHNQLRERLNNDKIIGHLDTLYRKFSALK